MQKQILILLLSFVFILGFSVDAEAQSRKKKKGKQRPAKTEQTDETSDRSGSQRNSGSQRSTRGTEDEDKGFSKDKLVFDLMGDFRPGRAGQNTILKFGLKPAVSYKVWPRVSFGVAPKIEYYFINVVNDSDVHIFDLGAELFGRVLVVENIYIQAGYDFNNYLFYRNDRAWINSPVIGGGYMSGFGNWKYGAQALFMLDEDRRDYNSPFEIWFGLTYNL